VYRQPNNAPNTHESHLLREIRLQEQQEVMDAIILRLDCRNKLINSKLAWVNNEQRLTALGISKVQFSQRCKVNSQSLTAMISRLRNNCDKRQPRTAQLVIPELAAGMQTGRASVRAETRLVDRRSIDNPLPILHYPDHSQHSLTPETLGLDANADVSQIKVTDWGSLDQVFRRLPPREREKLKSKLLIELNRQLRDEKGQDARMNTLMSNAGEPRLANGEDGINNLGMGEVNLAPAPVPADTLLRAEPEVLTATTTCGVNAFEPPAKRLRFGSVTAFPKNLS
jgi:hypothetical protein